ncbi:hypothetical protein BD626DRAFT_563290 [Schizophyllum amplum]|uniref:BTB domain-containing protein n=1 Tax=Schizophyllum amplum TaxID=97359 RepID=A0A550CXM9_9AGAR|nr:hypothetical protein BD626DRAFT_563290 [Auriculariopsis ampla]
MFTSPHPVTFDQLTEEDVAFDENFLNSVAYWDVEPAGCLPTPSPEGSPQAQFGHSQAFPTLPTAPVYSVSTAFTKDAYYGGAVPDTVIASADHVHFYVSRTLLARISTNGFGGLLPALEHSLDGLPLSRTSDTAEILNLILHAAHDMCPDRFTPSLPTLVAALDRVPAYGLSPAHYAVRGRAFYNALVTRAPLAPLTVYAAAARRELDEIAVAVSPHLLSMQLSRITDEDAEAMGPVYLKRFFLLHQRRIDALKDILAQAPYPHTELPDCNFAEQRKIVRAWQLTAAYLVSESRPDLPASTIESTVNALAAGVPCDGCREVLQKRSRKAVVEWTMLQRTI